MSDDLRSELTEVQRALAGHEQPPAESKRLRRRQRELLAAHGKEWSGLAWKAHAVVFRRGEIDAIAVGADTLLHHAEDIDQAAPHVRSLTIDRLESHRDLSTGVETGGEPLERFARILELPIVRRAKGLSLGWVGWRTRADSQDPYCPELTGYESLDDRATSRLLESGICNGLRAIVTNGDLSRLLGSGALDGVERTVLDSSLTQALRFLELPKLRALSILGVAAAAKRMPATIRELRVVGVNEDFLHSLAASPAAASIERLSLSNIDVRSLDALASFPRLRSLVLSGTASRRDTAAIARGVVTTLVATKLPTLRELALSYVVQSSDAFRDIARALGPQLELLDVRGESQAKTIVAELETLVAGDVWADDSCTYAPQPLLADGEAPEPFWDTGLVRGLDEISFS